MSKYYYDLHIHSCLSPCGDDDMTPGNIAGMSSIKGLSIIALTDHNSSDNCPAFLKACENNDIIGIPGMELTTSEEVHMLCLFEEIDDAMAFSSEVKKYRFNIKNKPEIFGNQLICDSHDNVVSSEENLLINATSIDIDSAYRLVNEFNGFICPAHIDKQSNGIIGILGMFPEYPNFSCVEISDLSKKDEIFNANKILSGKQVISNSDAHFLWDINEKENYFEFDGDTKDKKVIIKQLFNFLRNCTK